MVGQPDDDAFAEHPRHRTLDRLAGELIRDAKDFVERPAAGLSRVHPVSDLGDRVQEGDSPLAVGGDDGIADAAERRREPGGVPVELAAAPLAEEMDAEQQGQGQSGREREGEHRPTEGRPSSVLRRACVACLLLSHRRDLVPYPVHESLAPVGLDDRQGGVEAAFLAESMVCSSSASLAVVASATASRCCRRMPLPRRAIAGDRPRRRRPSATACRVRGIARRR